MKEALNVGFEVALFVVVACVALTMCSGLIRLCVLMWKGNNRW